eukprot:jgi/Mesen1/1484/ME000132S00427
MLAVFHNSVAQAPPELRAASAGEATCATGNEFVVKFREMSPQSIVMQLDGQHALCYTHAHEHFLHPREFSAIEDVYCVFSGNLENLATLRQMYGLAKSVCESSMVIEAYKVLRDRAPYPADQVIGELRGSFAFILFDYKHKKVFVSADLDGKVPLYWGMCRDGALAVSDDSKILKEACGNSFAPFPKGCYFSTRDGLRSYEHPLKALTPIPHVDSQGQMCGANFKVDPAKSLPSGMHHSGSAVNWNQY